MAEKTKTIVEVNKDITVTVSFPENTPESIQKFLHADILGVMGDYFAVRGSNCLLGMFMNLNDTTMRAKIDILNKVSGKL